MKFVFDVTPQTVTTLHRDEHDVSGTYKIHTKIFNDAALERNKRIRLEGLLDRTKKFALHEGEKVQFAFSIPQAEWGFFQRDYPDIAKAIRSRDEQEREKAARQLQILHPEWVIMAGNW